jgi:hypothetical protein
MKASGLHTWLKAFEQELLEVASRIEATRKKLLHSNSREKNDADFLTSITTILKREVMNLHQLGQRVNAKNSQLLRLESSKKE